MGCHGLPPERVRAGAEAIRAKTNKPFALNFLLFCVQEESFAAALQLRPAAIAFAWPRPEQDLKPFIGRAHDSGAKVTFMAGSVPEAVRAAKAGADIIIAQGTEGGGHVAWQASLPLIPAVIDAVAPVPVLAAGGIAMAAVLPRRWRLAPTARCSARASLPASNLRCIRISSRRSSIPTRMKRCSARFPMSTPGSCGR